MKYSTKTRFLSLALIIVMISSLFITGCEKKSGDELKKYENIALECGYKFSGGGEEYNPIMCAYKSDKSVFDIDDVTLEFSYGSGDYNCIDADVMIQYSTNIPHFSLLFINEDGGETLIKNVDENLISKKYGYSLTTTTLDEHSYISDVKFNHSENIKIPKELFTKDSGYISFALKGEDINAPDIGVRILQSISICYKKIGDKVILSAERFNEENDNKSEVAEKGGLESGFKISGGEPSPAPIFCAYKSDTNEFNIDDVTLDFFFGADYFSLVGNTRFTYMDYPVFDLYFTDDSGNKFFVKRIEENLISDKYYAKRVCDENLQYIIEIKYNHSEELTVPKEIFNEDKGLFRFTLYGENMTIPESRREYCCIGSANIYYKVSGDKVILSDKKFKTE